MYIKLSFQYTRFVIPTINSGFVLQLNEAPCIADDLPESVEANAYTRQDHQFDQEIHTMDYYHDCSQLSFQEAKVALAMLSKKYSPDSEGVPFSPTDIGSNQIITELKNSITSIECQRNTIPDVLNI